MIKSKILKERLFAIGYSASHEEFMNFLLAVVGNGIPPVTKMRGKRLGRPDA